VIDIFAAAGLAKPDILILSEQFLAEVKAMPHRNLAVERRRQLLAGEIHETLRFIARELVRTVRANVTMDWTMRENVRAHLRVLVKRILRKYGYPPDKQEKATQTVLEQAEVLSQGWAAA
jgi:type I restriction enzyme R subunit